MKLWPIALYQFVVNHGHGHLLVLHKAFDIVDEPIYDLAVAIGQKLTVARFTTRDPDGHLERWMSMRDETVL